MSTLVLNQVVSAFKSLRCSLCTALLLTVISPNLFAGGKAIFYEKDASQVSIKVAKSGAGMVSKKLKGVTFLVYGGNAKLQGIARKVAKRLNAEGMPMGFIQAVDHDNNLDTTHIDIYTMGGTQYGAIGFSNGDMESFEATVYKQATKAYEAEFGKSNKPR